MFELFETVVTFVAAAVAFAVVISIILHKEEK